MKRKRTTQLSELLNSFAKPFTEISVLLMFSAIESGHVLLVDPFAISTPNSAKLGTHNFEKLDITSIHIILRLADKKKSSTYIKPA